MEVEHLCQYFIKKIRIATIISYGTQSSEHNWISNEVQTVAVNLLLALERCDKALVFFISSEMYMQICFIGRH